MKLKQLHEFITWVRELLTEGAISSLCICLYHGQLFVWPKNPQVPHVHFLIKLYTDTATKGLTTAEWNKLESRYAKEMEVTDNATPDQMLV